MSALMLTKEVKSYISEIFVVTILISRDLDYSYSSDLICKNSSDPDASRNDLLNVINLATEDYKSSFGETKEELKYYQVYPVNYGEYGYELNPIILDTFDANGFLEEKTHCIIITSSLNSNGELLLDIVDQIAPEYIPVGVSYSTLSSDFQDMPRLFGGDGNLPLMPIKIGNFGEFKQNNIPCFYPEFNRLEPDVNGLD
jgi:hypothetical protein